MKTGRISDLPPSTVKSSRTGEVFTLTRFLTEGTSITDFSVTHETLSPGRRSSSPHFHSHKDELYLVLEGAPTVHYHGKQRLLSAGDFVVFESGSQHAHYLSNDTTSPVQLLMIASCPEKDDVHYRHSEI